MCLLYHRQFLLRLNQLRLNTDASGFALLAEGLQDAEVAVGGIEVLLFSFEGHPLNFNSLFQLPHPNKIPIRQLNHSSFKTSRQLVILQRTLILLIDPRPRIKRLLHID